MDKEHFNHWIFLDLAKISNHGWNNSSLERNIFGRLYYAAFLYVIEWLSNNTDDFNVRNNGKS